jgi:hypothetical protein
MENGAAAATFLHSRAQACQRVRVASLHQSDSTKSRPNRKPGVDNFWLMHHWVQVNISCAGVLTTMGVVLKMKIMLKLDSQKRPSQAGTEVVKLTVTGNRSHIIKFQEALSQIIARMSRKPTDQFPVADPTALEQMTVMGFSRTRANCALICSDNDLGAAIQWLQDNAHTSDAQMQQEARKHVRNQSNAKTESLTTQLMSMGYTEAALCAARAATGTDEAGAIIDWLHRHPLATSSPSVLYPPPSQPSIHPEPRFASMSSPPGSGGALHSHPVLGSSTEPSGAYPEPDMTVQNPYALYTGNSSTPSPIRYAAAQGSRPAGMEGLVAAQRAKASRIGADVRAGFKDLQVELLQAPM